MKTEKACRPNYTHFCREAWKMLGQNASLDEVRVKARELLADPSVNFKDGMVYKAKREIYGVTRNYKVKREQPVQPSFDVNTDTLMAATNFAKMVGGIDKATEVLSLLKRVSTL